MNDNVDLDRRLAQWMRAEAPVRASEHILESVMTRVDGLGQEHHVAQRILGPRLARRLPGRLLAAAVVLLTAVLGGAALAGAFRPPPPSPSPAQALIWSQSSLERDWPVPVRPEPVGGSGVVPYEVPESRFADPPGDIGPGAPGWVDIREMTIRASPPDPPGAGTIDLRIDTTYEAPVPTPQPHPAEQWIAYGLVLDTNADGLPDVRLGIDNVPLEELLAPGETEHRAWRADLDTGATVSAVGPPYGYVGTTFFDTFFPGERQEAGTRLLVDMPDGSTYAFYSWAATIADGRVVATDYAPDSGWLDPWP